ncbi:MAG TPA: TlpA disulfide reductase family protein [Dehalococcoidia bacterium]|nr:TlpA disulfide reductase family protein [Dehalococcoidia bacterium]
MPDDSPLIDEVSGVEERPQNRREWGGPLRSLVLPLLIVATIVGGLWWWEQRGGGDGADSPYGTVALPGALNTTGDAPAPEVGRAAPDFVLERPEGGTLRLSDLRGKPVLVNFWASWCAPCRGEMPDIVRAWSARRGDFAVVAVNLQENDGQVRAFADEFGMDFDVVIDRTGEVGETWRIGGPIEGIPSSYFIDADGVVRDRVFGELTRERIDEGLAGAGLE